MAGSWTETSAKEWVTGSVACNGTLPPQAVNARQRAVTGSNPMVFLTKILLKRAVFLR